MSLWSNYSFTYFWVNIEGGEIIQRIVIPNDIAVEFHFGNYRPAFRHAEKLGWQGKRSLSFLSGDGYNWGGFVPKENEQWNTGVMLVGAAAPTF